MKKTHWVSKPHQRHMHSQHIIRWWVWCLWALRAVIKEISGLDLRSVVFVTASNQCVWPMCVFGRLNSFEFISHRNRFIVMCRCEVSNKILKLSLEVILFLFPVLSITFFKGNCNIVLKTTAHKWCYRLFEFMCPFVVADCWLAHPAQRPSHHVRGFIHMKVVCNRTKYFLYDAHTHIFFSQELLSNIYFHWSFLSAAACIVSKDYPIFIAMCSMLCATWAVLSWVCIDGCRIYYTIHSNWMERALV